MTSLLSLRRNLCFLPYYINFKNVPAVFRRINENLSCNQGREKGEIKKGEEEIKKRRDIKLLLECGWVGVCVGVCVYVSA